MDDSKGDEKAVAVTTPVTLNTAVTETNDHGAKPVVDSTGTDKISKDMGEDGGDKGSGHPKRKHDAELSTTASSESQSGNAKKQKPTFEIVPVVKRSNQGVPTGCSPEKKRLKFDSESDLSGSEEEYFPEARRGDVINPIGY